MIRISVSVSDSVASVEVTEKEILTAGRVGLRCAFTFGSGWEGLERIAVFEGAEIKEVALGDSAEVEVPPECLAVAGYRLRIGVMGISAGGETVIPTVWAKVGKVQDSADSSDSITAPATPTVVAQILQMARDALSFASEVKDQAVSGAFDGAPGEAGFSPQANVTSDGNEVVITITDASGTTTARIRNWLSEVSAMSTAINNLSDFVDCLDELLRIENEARLETDPRLYRLTIPRASIGNNSTITIADWAIRGIVREEEVEEDEENEENEGYGSSWEEWENEEEPETVERPGHVYFPFLQIGDSYYCARDWSVDPPWITIHMATVPPPSTDVTVWLLEVSGGPSDGSSPVTLDPQTTYVSFSDPWTIELNE